MAEMGGLVTNSDVKGYSRVSGCGDYYVIGVALLMLQGSNVIELMGVALKTSEG